MSNKYESRVLSATMPTTSGTPFIGTASGIWEMTTYTYRKQLSLWPDGVYAPSPPTITEVISGYQSVQVLFAAPSDNGGAPIISYTVVSNPGGVTVTGSSSPIAVPSLDPNLYYSFTVYATNKTGDSLPSAPSASVRASVLPSVPTNVVAAGGYANSAVISFTASFDGGSPITGYIVTSSPGNITKTGTSSPITITGLTNNIPYTFTVYATNMNGNSDISTASNSVTPGLPLAPTLNSVTYSNGNTATVAFSPPVRDGGYPITGYILRRSDGATVTGTSSPLVMSNNFVNYQYYTFTVSAINSVGEGIASNTSELGAPKAYVDIPVGTLGINTNRVTVDLATIISATSLTSANLAITPAVIKILVNGNITSTSSTVPALTIDLASGLHASSTITIQTVTGNIVGCGGKGGTYSTTASIRNGANGGPGLKLNTANYPVTITINSGTFIAGGGGGGGAGGDGWREISYYTLYCYDIELISTTRETWSGNAWVSAGSASSLDLKTRIYQYDYVYSNTSQPSWLEEIYFEADPNYPSDPNMDSHRLRRGLFIHQQLQNYDLINGVTDNGITLPRQTPTYSVDRKGGSSGGNGYGYNGSTNASPGAAGTKTSLTPISTTIPDNNNYYRALKSVVNAGPASGTQIPGYIDYHLASDASAGSGLYAGAAGASPTAATNYELYGCGGGGGGGIGSSGGDGGSAAYLPSGSTTYVPAGTGGSAGLGITLAASTASPSINNLSLVYGGVQ